MANELKNSNSLYLQQHANNPVNWKSWSQEAFDLAMIQNKPVLVSIGYAACHWCHVMEKESFEDLEVANYMNEHFVCIKVDREEHPAVDHMYMDALIALNNQGGWPLNMFVTPEKKPFYGGTYFPPERVYGRPSWMEVLKSMVYYWKKQKSEIDLQSSQLFEHLMQINTMPSRSTNLSENLNLGLAIKELMQQADVEDGGFGNAPKFPSTMALESLLIWSYFEKDKEALSHVEFTLEKMLHSGIFDQVEGGLSRYSTDNDWKIPHFEKMLYDNALFVSLLAKCFSITKNIIFLEGIYKIIDFVDKYWLGDKGLYYSAMDADSEGEEGKYYIVKWEEIIQLLNAIDHPIIQYYQFSPEGNWEDGKNILHGISTVKDFCIDHAIDEQKFRMDHRFFLESIKKLRINKKLPQIDKKQQLSWNALWNIALIDAGKSLSDDNLFKKATQHLDNMLNHFYFEEELLHLHYKNYKIHANADDWAYFINAIIKNAEISQNIEYLKVAQQIMQWGDERFYDTKIEMYAFSDINDQSIIVRKIETFDNAQPSVNAIQVENLEWLGITNNDFKLLSKAEIILHKLKALAFRYPLSYGQTVINLILTEKREVISWDPSRIKISLREKWRHFSVNRLFLGFQNELKMHKKLIDENDESITGKAFSCNRSHCKIFLE